MEQMQEQHGVENINQQEYTKCLKQEQLARHAAEQKQVPKNIKVSREDCAVLVYARLFITLYVTVYDSTINIVVVIIIIIIITL